VPAGMEDDALMLCSMIFLPFLFSAVHHKEEWRAFI
jgi:hypothetical protein